MILKKSNVTLSTLKLLDEVNKNMNITFSSNFKISDGKFCTVYYLFDDIDFVGYIVTINITKYSFDELKDRELNVDTKLNSIALSEQMNNILICNFGIFNSYKNKNYEDILIKEILKDNKDKNICWLVDNQYLDAIVSKYMKKSYTSENGIQVYIQQNCFYDYCF